MFHPLSLFVGLRYVRARSHKFFVSFITWVSVIGVCVGVAALIVILSVMNGFEGELRDRLLSLSAHARIVAVRLPTQTDTPVVPDWAAAERRTRAVQGVTGVAPYAEVQVLAVRTPEMLPVTLRGIDPQAENQVTTIANSVVEGKLSNLTPGTDRVIIGSIVAQRLGTGVGDTLTLLIPSVTPDGTPTPKLREFTVAGVFDAGSEDHDARLLLTNLEDVRALGAATAGAQGLRVKFEDSMEAPTLAAKIRSTLPKSLEVIDWTVDHANYFRAIRIEKTMMALILLMVVGVAAFNIVAMLVMVVTDKRTDIAILRTLGASPRTVMNAFLTQGLVIGWFGVALGVGLGVLLARNVTPIVAFLERTFGFQILDADVYYITRIPSVLEWSNVFWIGLAALLLTGIATIYPAIRAARTPPAEALRYE